jgi:hypothetical protein
LALHDFDKDLDQAKTWSASMGGMVDLMPISAYIDFHARTIDLLASGSATPEEIRTAYQTNADIITAVRAAARERNRAAKTSRGPGGETWTTAPPR